MDCVATPSNTAGGWQPEVSLMSAEPESDEQEQGRLASRSTQQNEHQQQEQVIDKEHPIVASSADA
jgi:hypothetical protein